jgi:hypothetical protein
MSRVQIAAARADTLMVAYARAHRLPIVQTDELARAEGLVTPDGRLVYVGARWFLLPPDGKTRSFRVQLLTRGQRTVQVSSRARLAVNLCDLGYSAPQAGRHAFRAWGQGLSCNSTGRVIAQEVL